MFHRCPRVQQARDFKATFPFVGDNDRTAFDAATPLFGGPPEP